jgi:hypothetical protein
MESAHEVVRPADLLEFAAHVGELDLANPDDPNSERLMPYIREDLKAAFEMLAEDMTEKGRPFMTGAKIGRLAVLISETIAVVKMLTIFESMFGGTGLPDEVNEVIEILTGGSIGIPSRDNPVRVGPEPGNDAMRQTFTAHPAASNLAEAAGVNADDDPETIIAAIQKLLGS